MKLIDAETLIDMYLQDTVDPVKPRGPRRKSLAQKQGARKAGRTRSRKQYTESQQLNEGAGGWLTHYYYDKRQHPGPNQEV